MQKKVTWLDLTGVRKKVKSQKPVGHLNDTRGEGEKSFEHIKKLYSKTQPINIRGMFDGGFKDDYYHRCFMEDVQRIEQEVFYTEVKEQEEEVICSKVTLLFCVPIVRNSVVDLKKLNKILVGTFMVWDDNKYAKLFPKIKLLVEAKADINTKQGGGIFSLTLLERTFYSDHHRLRQAFINVADPASLEPKIGQSIFALACNRYNYNTMKILLEKNCEPNRIKENGLTPLITLCQHYTHQEEDTNHTERLKCIELLMTFEGPDARTLKDRWAKTFDAICPDSIGRAWRDVADFCIPNINVRPTFRCKNARQCLQTYQNAGVFVTKGMALLGQLFNDARFQREKYWPGDRAEYIRRFNPIWG